MLTLLNPSALLALLGLLVPVAIHLWNRRPGREVAVGSLRWLASGANRRLRNLKPEQLWLLLLRAALLAVLVGALAEPAWKQALPAGRGQVLLSPELLGTPALATLRPTLDSLRQQGYALRALAAGFPRLVAPAGTDSLALPARLEPKPATGREPFRWARVQQAAAVFPGQPLFVVTPATLMGFQGPHPALPAQVSWQILPTDTATTWLEAAAGQADSLRLLLGRSRATQTTFRPISVPRPRPNSPVQVAGWPPLRLTDGAAGLRLQPLPAASHDTAVGPAVPVRTQPLRVVVYATPAYAADARYLQAALRAAAVGLPVPLALAATASMPAPTAAADWLFWLADAPLPPAWLAAVRRGGRVWQEATGPGTADTATLVAGPVEETPVAVWRRGSRPQHLPGAAASCPEWTDGLGRLVLARRALGRGAVYQLSTRVNPMWSELADSPALPARLLALLAPEPGEESTAAAWAREPGMAQHDQRALDPGQLPTGPITPAGATARGRVPSAFRLTDLRPWLVLAAGLLLLLERLLAHRRGQLNLPSPA